MNNTEWLALADALKQCLNLDGTLYYRYDARLNQIIGKYSPANCTMFNEPKVMNYRCRDRQEVEAAINHWIEVQKQMEDICIIAHAKLELGRDNEEAKEEIKELLGAEGKMLVQGVHEVTDMREFPDWRAGHSLQIKELFNVGVRAIEVFQQKPTALVLFPNLTIPESRVLEWFYNTSSWSAFNNRSLQVKFMNTNGHFKIHVCTVAERKNQSFSHPISRKVGVLFTYIDPW